MGRLNFEQGHDHAACMLANGLACMHGMTHHLLQACWCCHGTKYKSIVRSIQLRPGIHSMSEYWEWSLAFLALRGEELLPFEPWGMRTCFFSLEG